MKVNNTGYNKYIEKLYKDNTYSAGKLKGGKEGKTHDRIELSDSFQEIKKYFSEIDSDIDFERVSKIKDAIGSGTYKISSEELAGKIIQKMKE